MRRWPWYMNTIETIVTSAMPSHRISPNQFTLPLLASENVCPTCVGKRSTMPTKMISEMPLPMPLSVICSPSHIRNIVPATNAMTAYTMNCHDWS